MARVRTETRVRAGRAEPRVRAGAVAWVMDGPWVRDGVRAGLGMGPGLGCTDCDDQET